MPSQDKVEEGEKNTEILKMAQVSLKNEVEEFALMTFCKTTVIKAIHLSSRVSSRRTGKAGTSVLCSSWTVLAWPVMEKRVTQ